MQQILKFKFFKLFKISLKKLNYKKLIFYEKTF